MTNVSESKLKFIDREINESFYMERMENIPSFQPIATSIFCDGFAVTI